MKSNRIIILDSLRGLASMQVLYHHIFKINNLFLINNTKVYIYKLLYFVSSFNQESVTFFFILSGFSIGLSLKDNKLTTIKSINEYIYKRFRRILPIYWFSLLVAFVTGLFMSATQVKDFSFFNLVGNLLFLQTSPSTTESWFTPYGFNGCLWTLAYELFFYLFLPLLLFVNSKFSNINVNLKFLLLLCATIVSILINKIIFIPYALFFGGFSVWALGYISSLLFLQHKRNDSLFIIVGVLGLMGILAGKQYIPSASIIVLCRGLVINTIFYFTINVKTHQNKLNYIILHTKSLINFLFYKIGTGSYSVYALHYPLLLLLKYYNINLYIQLVIIIFFIKLCILLEENLASFKFNFLKLNYLKILQFYPTNKLKINKQIL